MRKAETLTKMPTTKQQQLLACAIVDFLQQSSTDGTVSADDAESVGVAVQCIAEAFHLGADETEWKQHSIRPATLPSIFDLYLNNKKTSATKENNSDAAGSTAESAEDLKTKGNKKLVEKKYQEAIELYSQAIALQPDNAVYYANRAAAYSCLNQHARAIEDCQQALTVDPEYGKAYSRLGLAQYSLGRYEEAVDSYRQAIRLDPTNEAAKQALQTAEQKLQSEATSTVKSNEAGAAAAAAAKGPTAPGGGMDFASLLSNPQLMSMASEFMKNPAAGQMLQGLMGGGSGANPSGGASPASAGGNSNSSSGNNPLSGLLNNPQLMSMAQQFMSDPKMRDMLGGLGSGPSAGGSGSK